MVLLDSLNKRVKFLDEVITQLGLTGITAVHARAEEGARNAAYREQFDISVSRAVANLSTLVEYCLPFVKAVDISLRISPGILMRKQRAQKGRYPCLAEELKAWKR